MRQGHDQRHFVVRMEWGLRGAEVISQQADYAVIVDVLSFTTTVSVALDQGAEVFPYPWQDESAQEFARQHGAILAVGRSETLSCGPKAVPADATAGPLGATSGAAPNQRPVVSQSPASVRAASGLDRIVLPSPNGSALARALTLSGTPIVAACLRNRTAVATWLAAQLGASGRTPVIAVIAAGERWPDGTLRPAVEDLWGVGAVITALNGLGVTGLSPEARSAAAGWQAIEATLGPALASCSSGAELAEAGFSADVAIAGELDASGCIPVLSHDRFADARTTQARSTGQARSTAQARLLPLPLVQASEADWRRHPGAATHVADVGPPLMHRKGGLG